jgi:UDP-N-acetylmuramoylalanine--D-glutamate ligase
LAILAVNMQHLKDKHITVAGLGHFSGGIAVARWLVQQGARVLVTDNAKSESLAGPVSQLEGLNIQFRLGEHRKEDFTQADLIVASPAIAPTNPYLQAAQLAGVPITTEIRLFVERCPATILGVTGTKGKSTTTEMLGRMLSMKFKTWVGGNIGKSLLADLDHIEKTDLVVLELSSYMLAYLGESHWSPHVGLITLVSADHLAWHGSMDAYVDAKKNLLRYQRADDYAVLNERDLVSSGFARDARGKVIFYGTENRKRFNLNLLGEHNHLNAQGAFAAAGIFGIDWADAQKALATFNGLPHRLELIYDYNGIQYVNDSIATIPDAAVAALDSFPPKKVIQIVGGYDKGLPITGMCSALVERAKAVLCIGKTGSMVAQILEQSPSQSAASAYQCGDLATAVSIARKIAAPGDVVLLSPGFSSHDQFVNFEKRGEEFCRLVRGTRPAGGQQIE